MSPPTTAADLYELISTTGWCRDKIPHYADLERPLRAIVNKALEGKRKRTKKSVRNITLNSLGWNKKLDEALEFL